MSGLNKDFRRKFSLAGLIEHGYLNLNLIG